MYLSEVSERAATGSFPYMDIEHPYTQHDFLEAVSMELNRFQRAYWDVAGFLCDKGYLLRYGIVCVTPTQMEQLLDKSDGSAWAEAINNFCRCIHRHRRELKKKETKTKGLHGLTQLAHNQQDGDLDLPVKHIVEVAPSEDRDYYRFIPKRVVKDAELLREMNKSYPRILVESMVAEIFSIFT